MPGDPRRLIDTLTTKAKRAGARKNVALLAGAANALRMYWGDEHESLAAQLDRLSDELYKAGAE